MLIILYLYGFSYCFESFFAIYKIINYFQFISFNLLISFIIGVFLKSSKKFIVILLVLINFPQIFSQEITISGKVRDINTHKEIPNVNIFIKETTRGTITDFVGKFNLKISKPTKEMILVFQHIAYHNFEVKVDSVLNVRIFDLQPRIFQLQELRVEALGEKIEIKKDIPQHLSIVRSENFEIRGFTDAGDLLRTDHSVQIDEELSGKKTVAIRGGNPDEVIVLYNGIKMNSIFDNVFDLSLIELEDIERFEVIKGSNTTLYGTGALAGIINIIPKVQQDYTIRFQQRVGTYSSGNWGIHLYQPFGKLHSSYSFKQGASRRKFDDAIDDTERLENETSHHTANFVYNFNDNNGLSYKNSLNAMYIRSSLKYDNFRDVESLSNLNQVVSLKYLGDIYKFSDLNLSASYQKLDETQILTVEEEIFNRDVINDAFKLNAEKQLSLRRLEFILAYQLENAELKFQDNRHFGDLKIRLPSVQFQRNHHGFVAISKVHSESGYNFFSSMDFDVTVRHDRVRDKQSDQQINEIGVQEYLQHIIFDTHQWNETMFKVSSHLSGNRGDLLFSAYINFGKNVKFPTLFQQISTPFQYANAASHPNLNPEKNHSTEVGMEFTKDVHTHPIIYGWHLSGYVFQNYYDNKFRSFFTPGIPIAFYDNVQDARITGLESKSSIFLLKKKITLELGLSRYFISDKAVFPFKYDFKGTIDLKIDHAGFAFLLHLFKEGDQIGLIRQYSGGFSTIGLPSQTNLDLHLSKKFHIGKLKLTGNISARNLLNDKIELEGFALRDRRFYLTFGAQY